MKNTRLLLTVAGALVALTGTSAVAHHFAFPSPPNGTVVLKDTPVHASSINVGAQWRDWGNYFFGHDGVRYRAAIFSFGGVNRPVAIDYKLDAVFACRDNVMQTQFPVLWACENSDDDFWCTDWYPEQYEAYYAASAHCDALDQSIYYVQH